MSDSSSNLASIVSEAERHHANRPALIADDETLSYRELRDRIQRFAQSLVDAGLSPGDRVAILLPNIPEFTIAYFGILWAGGVVVPLNILLLTEEVGRALEHVSCTILVADRQPPSMYKGVTVLVGPANGPASVPGAIRYTDALQGNLMSGGIDTSPDDTAIIFYTSGTTGTPKGAEVTHANLMSNARWVSERSLMDAQGVSTCWGPGHVSLAALPFSHSFGQTCVQNASLMNGAAVCFSSQRFSPEAASKSIARHNVTVLAAVPTMIGAILGSPDTSDTDLATLTYCLIGGAPIARSLIESFENRTRAQVLEGYGLSETSPVIAFRTPGTPRAWGSVGRAIEGVSMGIVDDEGREVLAGGRGEVVVLGDPVMKGYLNAPALNREAFFGDWFRTGDIGYLDADGNLFLVDRKKDVILRGGYTVYPTEVEAVLSKHPQVAECCVIGEPDGVLGEEIVAHVVLRDPVTEKDLVAWSKERIAGFKYPRRFTFQESLPRGTKGQILKQVLRDAASPENSRESP